MSAFEEAAVHGNGFANDHALCGPKKLETMLMAAR